MNDNDFMPDKNLIYAENISYSYSTAFKASSQNPSVNHISFTLKRGEILAFLGPNGAGKSTTMKLLTGNLKSQSGVIKIAGLDLHKNALLAKNHIGYLADTPPLYVDQKVDEYLIFCARIHNVDKQNLTKNLTFVKQRCGLIAYGNRLISQLSKGIQQRIGIAQAIIHQPDIVILDEPTNGLDPVQRHEILTLIRELGEAHSVLISTHSWSDVQQAGCNKVQIINQGELVYQNSIKNLQQQLQGNQFTLCVSQKLNIEKLQQIKHVKKVKKSSPECFNIHCNESLNNNEIKNIASHIVKLANHENWGLYEIHQQKRSFDSVFLSLTQ